MAIKDRNLKPGTCLVARYKGQTFTCLVEKGEEEGKLNYVLADGRRFKSPSSAGEAVKGEGKTCNGWDFWSIEGEATTAVASPTQDEPKATRTPKTPKSKKLIYRIPSQPKDGEGKSRWFCVACMKSFLADGSEPPQVCPEGHRIDDPELTAPAAVEVTE